VPANWEEIERLIDKLLEKLGILPEKKKDPQPVERLYGRREE